MISSADLPLNDRGAVYHLDLVPDELADLLITVGDPNRVPLISQHFDSIEVKRAHREFVTHTGYMGHQRVTVLSTGIGMPNIDIVMTELDALVNIDLAARLVKEKTRSLIIIRLGTAGGIQPEVIPGDFLISQWAIGFDTLLNYYQHTDDSDLMTFKTAVTDYLSEQSPAFFVAKACPQLMTVFNNFGHQGITASSGGFYGPQGRLVRLPLHYPSWVNDLSKFHYQGLSIINFEMESAAILGLASLLGHRALSISVSLANRQRGLFTDNVDHQINRLIDAALQKLDSIT